MKVVFNFMSGRGAGMEEAFTRSLSSSSAQLVDATSILPELSEIGSGLLEPAWNPSQWASPLPPGLSRRTFGPASFLALAFHVFAVAALWLSPSRSSDPEAPPVRMIFFEAPPPPAAPVGAATAAATLAAPEPVVAPEPVPVVVDHKPKLRHASVPKARVPKPKPVAAPVEPVAAVADRGAQGGATDPVHGVVGGVSGGIPGGEVGGRGSEPIPAGKVAHAPTLIQRIDPVYPADARRLDVSGLVLLEVILDREGRIESGIKILKSVSMLDSAAIDAVRQWRFRPARDDSGSPVRVILEVPLRFVLR